MKWLKLLFKLKIMIIRVSICWLKQYSKIKQYQKKKKYQQQLMATYQKVSSKKLKLGQEHSRQYRRSCNLAIKMVQSIINESIENIAQKERMKKVVKDCGKFTFQNAHQYSIQCFTKKPDRLNLSTMREDDTKQSQTQRQSWRVPIIKKPKAIRQTLNNKISILTKICSKQSTQYHFTERVPNLINQEASYLHSEFKQTKQSKKKLDFKAVMSHKSHQDSKLRNTQNSFSRQKQYPMRKTVTYLKQMIPQRFVPLYQEQQGQVLLAIAKQEFYNSPQFTERIRNNKSSKFKKDLENSLQLSEEQQSKVIDFGVQKFTGNKTKRKLNKSKTNINPSQAKTTANLSMIVKQINVKQLQDQYFEIPKKIFLGNYVKKFDNKHQRRKSFFDIDGSQINQTLRTLKELKNQKHSAALKKMSQNKFIDKLNKLSQTELNQQVNLSSIKNDPKFSAALSSSFQNNQQKQNIIPINSIRTQVESLNNQKSKFFERIIY